MKKDKIVWEVSRNSPEEKLADFLKQMSQLSLVMRRQEKLKLFLTPFLHALFGGKTLPYSHYFPRLRTVTLILTLVFNVYFAYMTSLPNRNQPSSGSFLRNYSDWDFNGSFDRLIRGIHVILNIILAVRHILNSTAADDLPTLIDADLFFGKLLNSLFVSPLAVAYLLTDAIWPLLLVGFSLLGFFGRIWFYVPSLLDIMFQLKDMYFLYLAITRNLIRISFTLVLAFLCLYFFSVIAYLFFPKQYEFDGHLGCTNVVGCFKLHLDYGLVNAPSWDGKNSFASFIFELIRILFGL